MAGGDNGELGRPRIGGGDSEWQRVSRGVVGLEGGLAGNLWEPAVRFDNFVDLAGGCALSGCGCCSSGGRSGGVDGLSPGKQYGDFVSAFAIMDVSRVYLCLSYVLRWVAGAVICSEK